VSRSGWRSDLRRVIAIGGACAAFAAGTLAAPPGQAQPADQPRGSARDLGAEGLALYEQGDYVRALERFDLAHGLMPAPTLGIRAARCLVRLGRLVEASERYLEVTRFPLTERSPQVHIQAVQQASVELDALQPTIPTLTVATDRLDGEPLEAKIDGAVMPAAMLGQPQPLDPGPHRIELRGPDRDFEAPLVLKPGDKITLWLPPIAKPRASGPTAAASPPMSAVRRWGIASLVVGGAGTMMGVFSGALALAQQDALEARCPERSCPPAEHAAADRYDATRVLTTVGLVLGGVGLGAGATLMLLDSSDDPATPSPRRAQGDVALDVWLAPNGAGLAIGF
jgi:hypothetical protein